MKKLLLHSCCGPCFLGTFEGLKDKDFEITNYFYNPNIQPGEEWEERKENLRLAAQGKSKELIIEDYHPEEHAAIIKGEESDFPKRCLDCYRLRLDKTAQYASGNGYDLFSTTLLVSPYQQHEVLKNIGQELADKYGVEFYYQDFRNFYRVGQAKAKEGDLYRQKYCGCLYSKKYK
jgi:epoxyqueuosine reductase